MAKTTMYIYGLPLCSECVKGVIQAGISEVVMHWPDYGQNGAQKWLQSFELTKSMLDESGLRYFRLL